MVHHCHSVLILGFRTRTSTSASTSTSTSTGTGTSTSTRTRARARTRTRTSTSTSTSTSTGTRTGTRTGTSTSSSSDSCDEGGGSCGNPLSQALCPETLAPTCPYRCLDFRASFRDRRQPAYLRDLLELRPRRCRDAGCRRIELLWSASCSRKSHGALRGYSPNRACLREFACAKRLGLGSMMSICVSSQATRVGDVFRETVLQKQ